MNLPHFLSLKFLREKKKRVHVGNNKTIIKLPVCEAANTSLFTNIHPHTHTFMIKMSTLVHVYAKIKVIIIIFKTSDKRLIFLTPAEKSECIHMCVY